MTEPVLQIGGWSVGAIPAEWEVVPNYGLRRTGEQAFPSTVVLTEEKLPEGMNLPGYIKNQIEIIKRLLPDPEINGPDRFSFPEVDEAQKLAVAYKSQDGRSVVQTQIYAGAAGTVGIVTFTTIEPEVSKVAGAFRAIGSALRFGASTDAAKDKN